MACNTLVESRPEATSFLLSVSSSLLSSLSLSLSLAKSSSNTVPFPRNLAFVLVGGVVGVGAVGVGLDMGVGIEGVLGVEMVLVLVGGRGKGSGV